jgi:hypothetical protein
VRGGTNEVQEEEDVTYNKLERLRKENELKEVMWKDSVDMLALKGAVMLLLCILMGRFSPFLQEVNEKFP